MEGLEGVGVQEGALTHKGEEAHLKGGVEALPWGDLYVQMCMCGRGGASVCMRACVCVFFGM